MEHLSKSWVTDGIIDFEYKKYVLLAYLKKVKNHFGKAKLYPQLADLIMHYTNLIKIKDSKANLKLKFPHELSKIDLEKLQISYEKILHDDEVMQEIESIVEYALPLINQGINEGKEIYEFVEDQIAFEPIGLLPIYDYEGYFFLNEDAKTDVKIYKYQVSIFTSANEQYKAINTTFLHNDITGFSRSYNQIKIDLSKQFKELPNPATFLFTYKLSFPLNETILPIVKRRLIRELKFAA